MGVDYRVEVYRKEDNKKIAEFVCNQFKGIFDNWKYRNGDFSNFDADTIRNCKNEIKSQINDLRNKIFEYKNMIPRCENVSIKESIEEDIKYREESIEELEYSVSSCDMILGYLYAIVEDNIKFNDSKNEDDDIDVAYKYNAEGLPKDENGYSKYVWVDDIKCKLIADY